MSSSTTTPLSAAFGRLFWMMVGPLGLVLTTYFIVTSGTGWTTTADLVYFIMLGGMILGKWLEFRGGCPETSTGERATAADFRRYVFLVVTAGPVVNWLQKSRPARDSLPSGPTNGKTASVFTSTVGCTVSPMDKSGSKSPCTFAFAYRPPIV